MSRLQCTSTQVKYLVFMRPKSKNVKNKTKTQWMPSIEELTPDSRQIWNLKSPNVLTGQQRTIIHTSKSSSPPPQKLKSSLVFQSCWWARIYRDHTRTWDEPLLFCHTKTTPKFHLSQNRKLVNLTLSILEAFITHITRYLDSWIYGSSDSD